MTSVTELSHEIVNDYFALSNRPTLSVAEYLQFRQIAATEVQSGLVTEARRMNVEPTAYQAKDPAPKPPAPVRKEKEAAHPVQELQKEPSETNRFFDLINKIDS